VLKNEKSLTISHWKQNEGNLIKKEVNKILHLLKTFCIWVWFALPSNSSKAISFPLISFSMTFIWQNTKNLPNQNDPLFQLTGTTQKHDLLHHS
jgi:hypothetical protein